MIQEDVLFVTPFGKPLGIGLFFVSDLRKMDSKYLLTGLCSLTALASTAQFGTGNLITTTTAPTTDVQGADTDGDGDTDLVYYAAGTVNHAENNGSGSFGPFTLLPSFGGGHFELADLDGDTDVDLVVLDEGDNTLQWRANNGTGGFGPEQFIAETEPDVLDLNCADINGDGLQDVAITMEGGLWGGVVMEAGFMWFGNQGGGFADPVYVGDLTGGPQSSVLEFGDADLDGDLDAVIVNWNFNVVVAENLDGLGTWWEPDTVFSNGALVNRLQWIDADGDGDQDLAGATGGGKVHWAENGAAQGLPWPSFNNQAIAPPGAIGNGRFGFLSCSPYASVAHNTAAGDGSALFWTYQPGTDDFGSAEVLGSVYSGSPHFASDFWLIDVTSDGRPDLVQNRDNALLWYENQLLLAPPVVTLDLAITDPVGTCDPPFALVGGTPEGGVYVIDGVVGTTVDPGTLDLGAQVVWYVFSDPITQCKGYAVDSFLVDACVGTTDLDQVQGVLLSPNPTDEETMLTFSASGVQHLRLTDLLGRAVVDVHVRSPHVIDLRAVPVGLYTALLGDHPGIPLRLVKQ